MVTLGILRRDTEVRLSAVCGDSARFDADLLIEKATGIPSGRFEVMNGEAVDETEVEPLIRERLLGRPTQYILGEWEFYGLPFYVGEGVLIPRPDTEILVERSLELLTGKPSPRVLDLCAGSGCIGIAIGHHRPDASICAVELYEPALVFLKRNAERNGVSLDIRRYDVLTVPEGFGIYDLIVSNPPYISGEEMDGLSAEVKNEPHTALFGGEDGLTFYRALAKHWVKLLAPGGKLAVEIGYRQAEQVSRIFEAEGLTAEIFRDYGGNCRVIIGTPKQI